MNNARIKTTNRRIAKERLSILHQLEDWLELPMVVHGFVWLLLLIVEFATPWGVRFQTLGTAIWIVFIIDFTLKLAIAPQKLRYLRRNWLTLIALLVPALRVFRMLRAARAFRAVRGIRLLRVFSSVNRAMRALGLVLGKRGFGYVVGLTLVVTFAGSAAMFAFERQHGLKEYSAALWWTAMIVTTMGSEYWPKSGEGRVLCLFLALYAFAIFGYVTAALASFFVERDNTAVRPEADPAAGLRQEIAALRLDIQQLARSRRE